MGRGYREVFVIEARGDRGTVETTCLTRTGGLLRLVVDDRHGPTLAVTCIRDHAVGDEVTDAVVELPMAAVRAALAAGGWCVRPMVET